MQQQRIRPYTSSLDRSVSGIKPGCVNRNKEKRGKKLGWIEKALEDSPNNKSFAAVRDIFQSMLEDS
jgi:hypothetical protein